MIDPEVVELQGYNKCRIADPVVTTRTKASGALAWECGMLGPLP